MTETTKPTGLAALRVPFEAHQIGLLPRATKKDAEKGTCKVCKGYHGLPAIHLDYVGHAAVTDRLLTVDPSWYWEPVAFGADGLPQFDNIGGLWIRLTILGVTRLGYGNAEKKNYSDMGTREKEVIGDALRNAAMRFGVALDLWHKGDLHGPDTTPTPDSGEPPIDGHPIDVPERQDAAPPPPPVSPRGELPPFPKDNYEKNFPTWKASVESGAKTTEQVIATLSTRGTLNPVQLAKIDALRRAA